MRWLRATAKNTIMSRKQKTAICIFMSKIENATNSRQTLHFRGFTKFSIFDKWHDKKYIRVRPLTRSSYIKRDENSDAKI